MSAARVTSRRKAPAGRAIRNRGFLFHYCTCPKSVRPTNSGQFTTAIIQSSWLRWLLKFFVKGLSILRGRWCRRPGRGRGGVCSYRPGTGLARFAHGGGRYG